MDIPVSIFVVIAVIVWIVLNSVATYIVYKTYFIVKARRYVQTAFIWLVPYIGAGLAIYLNRQEYFDRKKRHDTENHPKPVNRDALHYPMD